MLKFRVGVEKQFVRTSIRARITCRGSPIDRSWKDNSLVKVHILQDNSIALFGGLEILVFLVADSDKFAV